MQSNLIHSSYNAQDVLERVWDDYGRGNISGSNTGIESESSVDDSAENSESEDAENSDGSQEREHETMTNNDANPW